MNRQSTDSGLVSHTGIADRIARYFHFEENNTCLRREVLAGITTFMAMAYITVVNPSILSDAGMDFGAVFVATCLAAAVGTMIMGVYANYPIALAPGMGQNAFFAYTVVLGMGHSWEAALAAVFISGLIFIALSILPVREHLINAIPRSLKLGMSAGIGLFLGLIALSDSEVVIADPATLISFGDLTAGPAVLLLAGFVLIAALSARKTMGAVIIGMLVVTIVGWLTGLADFMGVMSAPPNVSPVLLKMDFGSIFNWSMVTVILTLLLVDVFDTAGTLVGVATRANMLDEKGHLPRLRRALLADSGATVAGALLGTSSTTSYIESASGVEAGGRTGMTSVVTAVLFLLCLFFSPLAQSIPGYATGAALLFVACIMMRSLETLEWSDITESAPSVLTAVTMPLFYSISDGMGVGFISYCLIKLVSGRKEECPLAVYAIAVIFALKFVFLV